MENDIEKIKKDSTVLVCPDCQNTSFDLKGDSKTLLLACRSCGVTVTVKNGGVIEAPRFELTQPELAHYATVPVKNPETKSKPTVFFPLSVRVPESTRELWRAAILVAKEEQGIDGRAYAGTSMGYICADYLAGRDITKLSKETQSKVYGHLDHAITIANNENAVADLPEEHREHCLEQTSAIEEVKGLTEYSENTGVAVRKPEEQSDLDLKDGVEDEPEVEEIPKKTKKKK